MTGGGILLIALSNIGDAIMTTPVLQSLHALYPGERIDLVADQRSSAVFQYCPYRGRIYLKNKRGFLRGLPQLIRELRRNRYRLVVDLRTDLMAWLLRAERRLGKWNARSYGGHAVEKHMGVIHSLHGDRPLPDCVIWAGADDVRFAQQALQQIRGRKILAMGPGANYPGKIWPWQNYLDLIASVRSHFEAVVLLGDAKDREHARPIAEGSVLSCINLCGGTTLLQAAAILHSAAAFVGNDSGLGHMAAAVKVPTLTLFGIGQPGRYHPWGRQARWLAGSGQRIENITVAEATTALIFPAPRENG